MTADTATFCFFQVSVVFDDARVECDAGAITFKSTVMFQTRLFNFSLKNTGLGSVDYKWAVQTLDGAADFSGIYVVSSCCSPVCIPHSLLCAHSTLVSRQIDTRSQVQVLETPWSGKKPPVQHCICGKVADNV